MLELSSKHIVYRGNTLISSPNYTIHDFTTIIFQMISWCTSVHSFQEMWARHDVDVLATSVSMCCHQINSYSVWFLHGLCLYALSPPCMFWFLHGFCVFTLLFCVKVQISLFQGPSVVFFQHCCCPTMLIPLYYFWTLPTLTLGTLFSFVFVLSNLYSFVDLSQRVDGFTYLPKRQRQGIFDALSA